MLRLCREGRLFELQAWVTAGKPLTVPPYYRSKPLLVALDTGFHSLVEFLLQQETDQSTKDEVLRQACWGGQRAFMELALQYGARVTSVSFQDVIETWNRDLVRLFLERGADPVTNAPLEYVIETTAPPPSSGRAYARSFAPGSGPWLDVRPLSVGAADRQHVDIQLTAVNAATVRGEVIGAL